MCASRRSSGPEKQLIKDKNVKSNESHTVRNRSASPKHRSSSSRNSPSKRRSSSPTPSNQLSSSQHIGDEEENDTLQIDESVEYDLSSPLLSLPTEVLFNALNRLDTTDLTKIGSACRYTIQLVQHLWMNKTKEKHPTLYDLEENGFELTYLIGSKLDARGWRKLVLKQKGSISPFLYTTLSKTCSISNSSAIPPSRPWQFLYYHTTFMQNRNWLLPKEAEWSTQFTPNRKVIETNEFMGFKMALHQYHLFPSCIAADDEYLIAGSAAYESVGDPTTMMVGDRLMRVLDIRSGEVYFSIPAHPSAILSVDLDKKYFYSSSIDRSISLWDRDTGHNVVTLHGHTKAIYRIQLLQNSNSHILISAGKDNTIRFWDISAAVESRHPTPYNQYIGQRNNGASATIGATTDGNAPNDTNHNEFNQINYAPPICQVYYGKDKAGTDLVAPNGSNLQAGSAGQLSVILAHHNSVRNFKASGPHIVSTSGRGQGVLWDIETRTFIRSFNVTDDATSLDFHENDFLVASNLNLQHFDIRTPNQTPQRETNQSNARQIQFDQSKIICSDTKGFINIFDWNMFREISSMRVHKHRATFCYMPQSQVIYTGGVDKFIKKFDFSSRVLPSRSPSEDKKCIIM